MHVTLTDVLTCPRCGPAFGLILMPDEMRGRRVVSGVLGCPNCRERYRVDGGVAEFGSSSSGPAVSGDVGGPEAGEDGASGRVAVRVAGLLGLGEARGLVWVMGGVAWAEELAALVPDVEVVAAGRRAAGPTVSTLHVTDALPFRTASLVGVALTASSGSWLEEGARVVAPGSRLLLEPAPAGARHRVSEAGLRVLAEEGDTVVAVR